MTQLIHIAHLVSAAWAAAGELITAGALLWALNTLATAIRFTYSAGRWCGRLWFSYGLPALLLAADGISWLNAQIDWIEVARTVLDCLKVIAALAITSWTLTCDAHKRWIGSIDWSLPAAPAAPARPAVQPLFELADELQQLTGKQLSAITGRSRRTSKARMVATYLAA